MGFVAGAARRVPRARVLLRPQANPRTLMGDVADLAAGASSSSRTAGSTAPRPRAAARRGGEGAPPDRANEVRATSRCCPGQRSACTPSAGSTSSASSSRPPAPRGNYARGVAPAASLFVSGQFPIRDARSSTPAAWRGSPVEDDPAAALARDRARPAQVLLGDLDRVHKSCASTVTSQASLVPASRRCSTARPISSRAPCPAGPATRAPRTRTRRCRCTRSSSSRRSSRSPTGSKSSCSTSTRRAPRTANPGFARMFPPWHLTLASSSRSRRSRA